MQLYSFFTFRTKEMRYAGFWQPLKQKRQMVLAWSFFEQVTQDRHTTCAGRESDLQRQRLAQFRGMMIEPFHQPSDSLYYQRLNSYSRFLISEFPPADELVASMWIQDTGRLKKIGPRLSYLHLLGAVMPMAPFRQWHGPSVLSKFGYR